MACKLRCPNCDTVLKEEGDETLSAIGEYRIYDSLANPKHKEGWHRLILCLNCNFAAPVDDFDDMIPADATEVFPMIVDFDKTQPKEATLDLIFGWIDDRTNNPRFEANFEECNMLLDLTIKGIDSLSLRASLGICSAMYPLRENTKLTNWSTLRDLINAKYGEKYVNGMY